MRQFADSLYAREMQITTTAAFSTWAPQARNMLGWPKSCELALAFLWEYS